MVSTLSCCVYINTFKLKYKAFSLAHITLYLKYIYNHNIKCATNLVLFTICINVMLKHQKTGQQRFNKSPSPFCFKVISAWRLILHPKVLIPLVTLVRIPSLSQLKNSQLPYHCVEIKVSPSTTDGQMHVRAAHLID